MENGEGVVVWRAGWGARPHQLVTGGTGEQADRLKHSFPRRHHGWYAWPVKRPPAGSARMVGITGQSLPILRVWLVDSRTSCLDRQNTAGRAEIPGNDGGCPQKIRTDGSSLHPCGAACSTESPAAMCSHACSLQRKLKSAEGTSQSGKTVKALLHGGQNPRRTQMRSCGSSWAWRERRPWPMIV